DISGFNSAVPFVLLLLGLVVMARERSRRGGSAADEAPPPDYLADLPLWRRALPWSLAVAFLIVYVLFLANDFWVGVMASGLTLSLIFLSFVVVTGMGGMVSLAQGTFVLTAALTTGMLMNRYEWAMLPAIVGGRGEHLRRVGAPGEARGLRDLRRHRRDRRRDVRIVPAEHHQRVDRRHHRAAVAGHRRPLRHPPPRGGRPRRHRVGGVAGH